MSRVLSRTVVEGRSPEAARTAGQARVSAVTKGWWRSVIVGSDKAPGDHPGSLGSAAAPGAAVAQQPGQTNAQGRYGHAGRRAEYSFGCAVNTVLSYQQGAHNGRSTRFARVEGRLHYVSGRGRSPGSRLWMPFDARTCEAHQARISRTCGGGDGLARDPLARRALTFSAGGRGSWTSSLDRVPRVSDAIRCRDDIRVVQF